MFRRHHTPRQPCGSPALALTSAAAALLLAAGPAAAQVASDENPSAYTDPASSDGEDSVAVGSEAQANGDYSLAVGVGAIAGFSADDRFATAIGFEAQAGFWSTALGTYAEALGETSAAFGYWATAAGESSTALGAMSTADGMWSTAIGGGWAVGDESIAIGMGAQTDAYGTGGDRAIVIGSGGLASGHDSIALGYMSITDGDRAMALGTSADMLLGHAYGALAEEAVAIGYGAFVMGEGSVAVGVGSVAMDEDVFSIGRGGDDPYGRGAFTRRLVNVSDGEIAEDSSDAVTGGQLFSVRQITTTNAAAITTLNSRMGDAETAIAALEHGAAGDLPIAADNTAGLDAPDASGEDSLAVGWGSAAAGDGAVAMGSNSVAAGGNSLAIAGGAANGAFAMSIGDSAQASEDLSIALGHGAGAHALGGLALGAGAQATAAGAISLGSGSVAHEADTLSIGAAGFERRIVNVSDGLISETSSDAVTGGQLFATQSAVASALGTGAGFDAAGLFSVPEFIILGSNYDNVGGALGALNTQVETNVADIEEIRTAGGGGGGGDDPSAEIAALRAQVEALSSALDRLERGAIAGGEASGDGATAAGEGSVAEQYGDTAFGAGAQATGDPSTAIGFAALASGQHSTAIGGNASATGDLSTALGQGAVASGDSSLALGQGASAAHDNAVAIGQAVATTRANQVAIGSADHTYTLAGLSSDASLAAQSGAVRMVTADASGNLATMDMQPWFERVGALEGRADVYDERWRVADDSFDRHADGVATALALGGAQILQPGQRFSMSANIGHFDGSSAVGFGAIGRLNERVSVNVGVGAGFRTGTVAGRAGISFGW
jgi:trimeric autotransporter adhesin